MSVLVRISMMTVLGVTLVGAFNPLAHLFDLGGGNKARSILPESSNRRQQDLYGFQSNPWNDGGNDNVDDIFALLADIDDLKTGHDQPDQHLYEEVRQPHPYAPVENVHHQKDNLFNNYFTQNNNNEMDAQSEYENESQNNILDEDPFMNMETVEPVIDEKVNLIGQDVLERLKQAEDLLLMAQKIQMLYTTKKEQLSGTIEPVPSGNYSSVIDLALDTPTLQNLLQVTSMELPEDEMLEALTNVITGAETRGGGGYGGGGSALTLDPVTIISLLTLAAYLIRAVYQILTVTGRSLDVGGASALSLTDMPEFMVSIHNWLSPTDFNVAEQGRMMSDEGSMSSVPGTIAAVLKLERSGNQGCTRRFLCEKLADRPWPQLTASDMLISTMGYYYGEHSLGSYIENQMINTSGDCGDILPITCDPKSLDDAHSYGKLFSLAATKLSSLLRKLYGYRNYKNSYDGIFAL